MPHPRDYHLSKLAWTRDEGAGIQQNLFEEKIWSEMIADYILSTKGLTGIPTPAFLIKLHKNGDLKKS